MTTTLEQAVSQIQQEILAIRAQLASRVHEDTPKPIDVNSQGCPKEFSGKEEDCQQWTREVQTFLAGEIKESEMMLEWAADHMTEITMNAIDLKFMPTDTNKGRGVRNLEFVLQHA